MKSTVDCRIMMQFCLNRNSAGVAELLGNERGLKVKRLRPQSNFVTESIVLFYNKIYFMILTNLSEKLDKYFEIERDFKVEVVRPRSNCHTVNFEQTYCCDPS